MLTNIPLVSIVVPCYNVEKFVSKALESVFLQSYTNWECLIIDDGSTDGTKNEVEFWLQKDVRFQYFFQKNKGLSVTRNEGLNHAKGDFVYFLDSDDLLCENAIGGLLGLVTSEIDIVFGKTAITEGQNKEVKETLVHSPESLVLHRNDSKYLLKLVIEKPLLCIACNRLYRMSFLKQNSLYFTSDLLHEDELWFFETLFFARGIILNDKPTYFYNVANVNSITNNYSVRNLTSYLKIIKIIYKNYYKVYHSNLELIGVYITYLKITTIKHTYHNLSKTDKKNVENIIKSEFDSVDVLLNTSILTATTQKYFQEFSSVETLPIPLVYSFLKNYYSLNIIKILTRKFLLTYAKLVRFFAF